MSGHLSSKAIVCTAHLMLLQNPKAVLSTAQWVDYLMLVMEWAKRQEIGGVRYYFHPEMDLTPVPVKGPMH